VSGRHMRSSPTRRRRTWRPLGAAMAAVLVLALAGTLVVARGSFASLLSGCRGTLPLEVVTGPGTAPLLRQLAGAYAKDHHKVGNRCVEPNVTTRDAAAVVSGLAQGTQVGGPSPDVWLPASSAWANLLDSVRPGLVPAERPKVATSPLVLAMPRPMAQALGWPAAPLGWSDMLKALRNPAGWGQFGHPDWGPILLGKTNPTVSTAGLHAGIATFTAVSGGKVTPTLQTVTNQKIVGTFLAVERSPGPYAETTEAFLAGLQQADDQNVALRYLSALPAEEKAVFDYNQGNPDGNPESLGKHPKPRTPLAAVYPKEGTLESDHPWLVLRAPWVTEAKRRAAADFLGYLRSSPVQARFTAAGFRSFEGTAGPAANQANGLLADQPRVVMPFPTPKVTQIIAGTWEKVRKRGNVLAVVDVSGSMNAKVPGTPATKLDLARRAAVSALPLFSDEDNVGLWTFNAGRDGARDWRVMVPLGRMGDLLGGLPRRVALAGALKGVVADGGTGLYDTTLAAVRHLRSKWVQDRINTVVLLTDGRNEKQGGTSLASLLTALRADGGRPVRIITIAYGADADQAALRRIAEATRGPSYVAADPKEIQRIFILAISNF
jgi:Ca-activated chloride channel family protein